MLFAGFFVAFASLWVVWPAFGASGPAWMGAADGFVLAKARFLAQGFGLGGWNRYWFLGIPGQHIGSPVIPWLLSLLTGSDPVSFGLWRSMVALGVVGSGVAAFFFAKRIFEDGDLATISTSDPEKSSLRSDHGARVLFLPVFVVLFSLMMPSVLILFPQIWRVVGRFGWPSWTLFAPFFLGDGQRTIAYALVLVASIVAWKLMARWSSRLAVGLSFLVAVLFLVDSASFLTFLLWLAALLLTVVVQPKLYRASIVVLIARLLSICLFGFLLAGFWFTPGYIYTLFGSPSLGGKPFTAVVISLMRGMLTFLPAVFGVIAARRWLRKSPLPVVVGLMGLLVFGSLTLAAFFADPDFWQDYSRFGRSLDLNLALLVGGIFYSRRLSRVGRVIPFIAIVLLGLPFLFQRGKLLGGSIDLIDTAEYRVDSELARLIDGECDGRDGCPVRAYLSGSTVFWLNSWFDVEQVRGGGEMGSVNDWWPHGSFQIREGVRPELAETWLEVLGVSYFVVHGLRSQEVYHDFRFPQKFDEMEGWENVWEKNGDTIYKRSASDNGSFVARVVDIDILKVAAPQKGDDLVALRRYTGMLRAPAEFRWLGSRELVTSATIDDDEGMRLAIAYSPFWRVREASVPVEIVKDPLGMVLIRPERARLESAMQGRELTVRLRFEPWLDLLGGVLMTVGALYVLLRQPGTIDVMTSKIERFVGHETELDRTAL